MNSIFKSKLSRYIFIVFMLFSTIEIWGKVIEQNTVSSQILKQDVNYSIYLPPDYDSDDRSYPVIYLLHGYGDDHTTWIRRGGIDWYTDQAIKKGVIPPVIIIMPNAGVSMYVNSYDGKYSYEDFFIKEFIPTVENRYHIQKDKWSRAVTGHSMGGWGSLLYAMKYPDLFVACTSLSPGVHDDYDIESYDNERWDNIMGDIFGRGLRGKERLNKYWYENSILKIVENKSADDIRQVDYLISCGDEDYLRKGSFLLHSALSEKQVKHEFRIKDGGHTWDYWRNNITETLEFITRHFQ